ncbi:unnamed protein product [Mytilus edulis]|uniref:Uncharacterized protein n=1 Tax=Mytilus edulis TaxID=6550 RepID=A0A8S3TBB2_MYTED|nr:unnamed protein product [Mytilus edulis]
MDKNTKRRNQQLLTVYKIADEYLDGAHKEEQKAEKKKTINSIGDNEVQTEKKHEKSHIVPSKTPEVNLSNGGKLGGKFTNGKLGGKFANDVKRKDDNEIRFRFSFLHGTTTYPSGISVMVRRFNGKIRLKRLNNEKPHLNAVRLIIYSTRNAKSPNGDDRRSPRKREGERN